jgi:hypothetical protein
MANIHGIGDYDNDRD